MKTTIKSELNKLISIDKENYKTEYENGERYVYMCDFFKTKKEFIETMRMNLYNR